MNSIQTNQRKLLLIPLITVLSGFLPFCLLSIYSGVFWIDTTYDIPLIYNWSVMIGDSILLPIINYQIAKLLFWDITVLRLAKMKKTIVIWIIITFLLSTVVNVFAHLAWKNDMYSDFISIDKINFLTSGWWHLIFSILEMTIMFLFPLFWLKSIEFKIINGVKRSIKIWFLVFFFSTLASLDMLMKFLFVYKLTFLATLKTDYFAFVTPSIAILLLLLMVSINAHKKE